jgi:hypothetical protein
MKFIFERGDLVLFPVATDGQGNDLYQYAMVEMTIGETVYLGGGIAIPMDKVLPGDEQIKDVLDEVNHARISGAKVFRHKEIHKGCA